MDSSKLEALLPRLKDVRKSGEGYMAKCPAHDDGTASLSIGVGDTGCVLVKCHAGCQTTDVLAAVGMTMADLAPSDSTPRAKSRPRIVATYDYRDEAGELLYQVVRFAPKDFRQRRPDGKGGWNWSIKGVQQVLYRLPELMAADPAEPVYVVEGEKDADGLVRIGLTATTNSGGAGKWRAEFADVLRGRPVVILPDNDDPGRNHAQQVTRSLHGVAAIVRIVALPGLPAKGDVSDWLAAGGTAAELATLADDAPPWQPMASITPASPVDDAIDVADPWPDPPDEAAFSGLAGEIVRTIEPHTEADPVAVLVQLLAAFGSAIGRFAYFRAEADRHYGNLFANLVGRTSKGRKGSSWGQVARVFAAVDQEWQSNRVLSGLSSGEGLIWAVRDPIHKKEPIRGPASKGQSRGPITGYEDILSDPGVDDKRLLVLESEFASVLKVASREKNTLSAILRQAWDTGTLRTLTKNAPAAATDAHISIIGHITRDELRRQIAETDMANGLANRFLWICVRRSKCLPEGGAVTEAELTPLYARLAAAMDFASTVDQVRRDDNAREVWAKVYPSLSEGRAGLLGAATSRAESQVMRLAMLYALLDQSNVIQPAHLLAGLAVWQYAEASAKYIFGSALGDPTADEVLAALRTAGETGMTRTQLRDHFARHKPAEEISRALGVLAETALARKVDAESEGGRKAETWFANA